MLATRTCAISAATKVVLLLLQPGLKTSTMLQDGINSSSSSSSTAQQ
jgi:hypothetical protein